MHDPARDLQHSTEMSSDQIGTHRGPAELKSFLRRAHAEIMAEWRAAARRLPGAAELPGTQLSDHIPELLHELADTAYFRRKVLVASAHNMPVDSFPWRFSSVISVGSHEEDDPFVYYANQIGRASSRGRV